ncbi:MAG TPA: hypothetical protein VNX02_06730 [Steroidobacteraceae bacterium]|nr:hypothetical protein [Steroidobacteraceae bacterium]
MWHAHRFWVIRVALVLLATGLAEMAVVWLAPQPRLWAVLVAGSLPLSLFFLVAVPLLRREGAKA